MNSHHLAGHDDPADQRRPHDLRSLGPISNDTVLLRAWQPSDLPAVADASRDPYIPLITTVPTPYTPEQGQAWLQRQWDQAAEGRGFPHAIVTRDTHTVVGMATITSVDSTHRRASIGYWTLSRHRGHGYAKAAVALLPALASRLGLVRLEALVEPSNRASQEVCRSAGFIEEGTLRRYYRIGTRNRDMIMFALLLPTPDAT
jgi:ribosomal-protein-alanine N-acetyltransferase